ncbi:MAG: ATPase domain-containing protein [Solirubrobacteraceae bacterium]
MVDGSGLGSGRLVLDGLSKAPTWIPGLDEVTDGGLPRGRTTLLCGGPGCGRGVRAGERRDRPAVGAERRGVCAAGDAQPADRPFQGAAGLRR